MTSNACLFLAAKHPPSWYCSRPTSRDGAALGERERYQRYRCEP